MQPTVKTTQNTLPAFLAHLLANPDDEATRLELATHLDTLGPSPVDVGHLPNWLRLAWTRNRPEGVHTRYRSAAAWSIVQQFSEWLSGDSFNMLDHWGSTKIGGELAFVNEPYAELTNAIEHLRPLAVQVGAVLAFAHQSHHGYGTVRVLLFQGVKPELTGRQKQLSRFRELTKLEPRLAQLMREARKLARDHRYRAQVCANAMWYGHGGSPGLKQRVERLVDWERVKDVGGELATEEAYDAVYEALYDTLPDCRKCGCIPVSGARRRE